jgi:hypothetical protein
MHIRTFDDYHLHSLHLSVTNLAAPILVLSIQLVFSLFEKKCMHLEIMESSSYIVGTFGSWGELCLA